MALVAAHAPSPPVQRSHRHAGTAHGRSGRRGLAHGGRMPLENKIGSPCGNMRRENPMNRATLALLIHGGTENWSPERWKRRFDDVCRGRRVVLTPDAELDPAEVHYAAVWKPSPGELAAFPNLRVIFNLGAGVDALMADASFPKVPVVRVAVSDLTARMTEYVVLHVLMHHRQELYLRASQRDRRWAPKFQWPARAISVGIMGLGTL